MEVHLPRVLESRSAGQRALAPPTDGHPPAFRNPQRQFSHYATAFQLRYGRNQPPLNHFPNHPTTAFQPRPNHRKPQPLHNRPSAARRTIPRLANTHDSTILRVESKNDSDSTIPHPRSLNRQRRAARARLVHQLPRPSRHFLLHPRPEGDCEAAGTAAMSVARRIETQPP